MNEETLRVPNENDADQVARLLSKGSPEPVGSDSVLRDWSFPGVRIELDVRLGSGSYAFVDGFGDGRVWIEVAGRPTTELLDWAEMRARELGSRLLSGGWTTQEPVLRELERRGFGLVRTSYRMGIDLAEPTPEPVWPDGVDARGFEPGDEQLFYDLHQQAFKDSWEPIEETYDQWAHQFLVPEVLAPTLWTLAVSGDELAGFAICHPHAVRDDLGWVRVLGVSRTFRGRGLGRALLLRAFAQFRQHGMTRAGLGVDATSPTGANRLYESAGMHVYAQFAVYEKDTS